MQKLPVKIELSSFPEEFHKLLTAEGIFDSSCSPQARVWYLPQEGGLFLKSAPKGALHREAEMTDFLHKNCLAPEVLAYRSYAKDWLLTRAVPGEDCTCRMYLDDPKRLSALLGELLRTLHQLPTQGCPITNHTEQYLAAAEENYRKGLFDPSFFPGGNITAEKARAIVQEIGPQLKGEVILHGDYCLPNVMLNNWDFSGFIDLDHGGVGDRHIDLFWGAWSLGFNLGTDKWRNRFLDAYGRDRIDMDLLTAIGAFETFG